MPQICETPAGKAGATREMLAGLSRDSFTPLAMQAQRLVALHHVRPEWAAMLAALAFGGLHHG